MSNSKSNQEDIYDSPTGAPYIYSQKIPHPRGGKFIRLLELLPGDPSDNICCSLHLYALDSCPRYEALSYTWGAAMNTRPIKIDDEILDVTRKLRCALRHLRSPSRPRLLWVDAVCMYSYRTAMKHLRNLRFMPQFSEGFNSPQNGKIMYYIWF